MKKEKIEELRGIFEDSVKFYGDVEIWMARDIHQLLGYSQYRNFLPVIDKAKEACKQTGDNVGDHFADVRKMVEVGSGAMREITDVMLTRYACYLIAQNGDPRKEAIAFAQSYFALQTRKQELIEERLRLDQRLTARKKLTTAEADLSKNIYERGVDQKGFGRIRSKGDNALFGGISTANMKDKMGVPKNRPLADFLPTVTITAKQLAVEATNHNVKAHNLKGEQKITSEHVSNNKNAREFLLKAGIKPEELPPEEDIKKLERKVKSAGKKLLKQDKKLKGK